MTHEELENAVIIAISNAERAGINLDPLTSIEQMLLDDEKYIRPQARAAIAAILEALSEPDADMLGDGMDELYRNPDEPDEEAERVWRAALAASPLSLKEERE